MVNAYTSYPKGINAKHKWRKAQKAAKQRNEMFRFAQHLCFACTVPSTRARSTKHDDKPCRDEVVICGFAADYYFPFFFATNRHFERSEKSRSVDGAALAEVKLFHKPLTINHFYPDEGRKPLKKSNPK